MNRFFVFVQTTVGGYVGGRTGEYVGFGLMGTFLVSSLGGMVAICMAWRVLTDYLS
jgi:hypothetical protein